MVLATSSDGCTTLTAVTVPLSTATRPVRRAITVLAAVAILTGALITPAAADTSYDAAKPLGLLPTLLLFVGGPIGLFLLIWLLVVAGSLARRPRREDDLAWLRDLPEDDATGSTTPELAATATAEGTKPVTEPAGSTQVAPGA